MHQAQVLQRYTRCNIFKFFIIDYRGCPRVLTCQAFKNLAGL